MHNNHCVPAFFTLSLVLQAMFYQCASAAVLEVNSLVDVIMNDSMCTLREAVAAANADADGNGCMASGPYGSDQIIFSQPGTISLTDELEVLDDLEIGGDGGITLDADGNSRIMHLDGDGLALRLTGLTIENGIAPDDSIGGGCIIVFGEFTLLELTDVLIQNCMANQQLVFDSSGGAIAIGRSSEVLPRRENDMPGGHP